MSFEDDQKSYEYLQWCRNGGKHQAYLNKKCNVIKNCNKAIYTALYSSEFSEDALCEEHKDAYINTVNCELTPFISNSLKPYL